MNSSFTEWPWLNGMTPEELTISVLKWLAPLVLAFLVVHVAVRALRYYFPESDHVRRIQRLLGWGIWVGIALSVTGTLPWLLDVLENIRWRMSGVNFSLRTVVEGIVTTLVVLALSVWLSSFIESRLLANVQAVQDAGRLSLRKMAANMVRAILLTVGILLALSAVGIPLTALSVFGGALGVGIGLGLQKMAANYVSGFIILAERSIRIGDVVKVEQFEGRITDIKTRYTTIRSFAGRESIVPNEMLLTQRIENATLSDTRVLLSTTVLVDAATDIEALISSLLSAVKAVPRVLIDPPPAIQLSQFLADGLELQISFWIADPENGQGNVKSDVNRAILKLLRDLQIPFPVATRVIQQK